jgi:hypothetical protein
MKTKIFLILLILSVTALRSQNITNTLGTSGVFTIKDDLNSYMTLNQSTGQLNILKTLRLENSNTSTTGIIFKGNDRFIHNYNTGTSYNTFIGINSGNFTLSASSNNNTGIGYSTLMSLTSGNYNTALGYSAMELNTSGGQNTALGYSALELNTTGSQNTSVGGYSLRNNTTGFRNTAAGFFSLASNSSGYYNVAVGYFSLQNNSTGHSNTSVGYQSLHLNNGYSNTAVGRSSLSNNSSGFENTSIGFGSGSTITSGSNLTCLGFDAEPNSSFATNQITLGNSSVTSLRCNVTTITSLSDARDKKNIKNLTLGLDFISKLKPRLYNWDKRDWYENNVSDGSKMQEIPTAGFIAQELDSLQISENAEWLNLVLKNNPDKLEATPGNLLPVMVKAIQELKEKCDLLQAENTALKMQYAEIKKMNEDISALRKIIDDLKNSVNQTGIKIVNNNEVK